MTIEEAIKKGMLELKNSNIESPKLKSRLLMQFMLNKPRQYVIVNDRKEISLNEKRRYFDAIAKMRRGIPLEYITNQREFMKLNFFVNENVLVPRQDTEVLVEEVIGISQRTNAMKILDLCTGSGAIAVSIAKYIPESKVTAVDISNEALKVAKKNAINNCVESQITFVKSDMFMNLNCDRFDIIVSNPPYIRTDVIGMLDKDVKNEPFIALNGGEDGLYFYKKIVKESFEYLKYRGFLCLEIGYDQKIDVIELIENEEKFQNTYSKKDLYGNDRVIVTQLK